MRKISALKNSGEDVGVGHCISRSFVAAAQWSSLILQSLILHFPSDHCRRPLKSLYRQLLSGLIPRTVGPIGRFTHSQRCTGREDIPVAGSCVSSSAPHGLWHAPHVIPAWQTQSTSELTSTASPAEHVTCCYNLPSDEEQENILPYTSWKTTMKL